jgi:hypothetical protein
MLLLQKNVWESGLKVIPLKDKLDASLAEKHEEKREEWSWCQNALELNFGALAFIPLFCIAIVVLSLFF